MKGKGLETCCDSLQRLIERAGEKGFGVVPFRDEDYRVFYLIGRPLERDITEKLWSEGEIMRITPKSGDPVAVTLSMRMVLAHCPSCGAKLKKLIREQTTEFDDLAATLSHLAG